MASEKTKRGTSNTLNTWQSEYPLGHPYTFEGFSACEEAIQFLADSIPFDTRLAQPSVQVLRQGSNAYGTWGQLRTWENDKWIFQGYTLERRPTIGKGHIPNGSYQFNRWMSPKLGKTLRLHNVSGFTDILVHVGNTEAETEGCILAARKIDQKDNPTRLLESRVMTDWLYDNKTNGVIVVQTL